MLGRGVIRERNSIGAALARISTFFSELRQAGHSDHVSRSGLGQQYWQFGQQYWQCALRRDIIDAHGPYNPITGRAA